VPNVCNVVITTNHKLDGLYLPENDRRHFMAWSERTKAGGRGRSGVLGRPHHWFATEGMHTSPPISAPMI
jgi:hypothetical protein